MTNQPAVEAVADMVGEWLHRMHGVTSSCDHHVEAHELLVEIRTIIHADGPRSGAVREALGLPAGGTHNHYFLNRALCGERSQTMRPLDHLPLCPKCQAIYATLPETEAHDCANCADCIHNGAKCCGCYDGACCKDWGGA